MSLYSELKRRNVFRVAIAYLALAWLLTEVAGTLFPVFGIPEWSVRFIVLAFALGFLPALIFSWVYELTPEGLKREKDVVRDQSTTHLTAKRLDGVTIGLIVVVLLFTIADRFWLSSVVTERESAQTSISGIAQQPDDKPAVEAPADVRPSIAVLPFANRSANPDDAFFVDGIHDDLLSHIARIHSIKTISRTSVMRYRDSTKSIPEIARELGVSTILEGGVQRADKTVRINVQLIDAQTDEHLWTEIYDRQLTANNIFVIQSEIAEAIATALKASLSPLEEQRIRAAPTQNLAAYEAYLIGKQRFDRLTSESLAEAEEFFGRAVALDPEYALAWVGLADVYIEQAILGNSDDADWSTKVVGAIETALDLDTELGEAYTALGKMKWQQNDLVAARQHYERALELTPNYPPLNRLYGILLEHQGRWEESLIWTATAVELDPMSPELRRSYAVSLREGGRFDDALEQLEVALDIDPDFARARDAIATMRWHVYNQLDQAAQDFVSLIGLDPSIGSSYIWLAQMYLDLGESGRASLLVERGSQLAPGSNAIPWGQLLLHLFRGEPKQVAEDARLVLTAWSPSNWMAQFSVAQLRNQALANGQPGEAKKIYSQHYPTLLLDSDPDIGNHNYRSAVDLAFVLQQLGEQQRADALLKSVGAYIKHQPRLGWWGGYWVADAQILAIQGRNREAIRALRMAADEGWRSLWWYYLHLDPSLEPIRGEPDFQAVVRDIENDMAHQMQQIRDMEKRGEIESVPGLEFTQSN